MGYINNQDKYRYAQPVGSLMYTPLETVFNDTMLREGRTVTAYTSGNEFQAFMRRNDDGNNFEDRITLYYSITAPVIQGSLVSYGNKIYILVNRETEENNCYYKSSGLACNGMITLNDGMVVGVPCYAYNMNNALVDENQVISVLDGNMEFLTESNSLSRQIKIGDTFNEFGRTFKVDNIYYKDGILHLVTEVAADEKPIEHLNIIIDGLTEEYYNIGDTAQLTATLYINNIITTGTVTWESTNTSVATIDGTGLVTFIANGSVAFKAYWVEKNTQNTTNTVGVGTTDVYTVSISGRTTITPGFSRTLTAVLMDKNGNEVTGNWEFTIDFAYPKYLTTTIENNQIILEVEDVDDVYGETITVTVNEINHNVFASHELLVQWF